MSTHRKAYRFRMRPTEEQEQVLNRMAGARRWVYNWALSRRREHYKTFGKTLSYTALWNRTHVVPIDRFFPSSKMCNRCGAR